MSFASICGRRATFPASTDPLDSTTAPAGNPRAFGHTAFLVDGTDFQSLGTTQEKLDLLFPLPAVTTTGSDCSVTRTLNLSVQNRVRVLTRGPWSRSMPKTDLGGLFGGITPPPSCSGSGNATVTFTGSTNDTALRAWTLQGEMQHARDDRCLVDRYLKAYEADVAALPATIPRGYLGFGDCTARLEERLNRPPRAVAFVRDWTRWGDEYDSRAGGHLPTLATTYDSGCNTLTATVTTPALANLNRDCTAWSPP